MIKTILFDMGGIVAILDPQEAMRRFAALGFKNIEEYLGMYGQKGIFLQMEMGQISVENFIIEFEKIAGVRGITADDIAYAWLGYMKDVPMERLHFINSLRNRYRVALFTNTNAFVQSWAQSEAFNVEHKPVGEFFDAIYCSNEMHCYKPDREFFLKVLEAEGLKAEECLFIDDSKRNTEAAEAIGFRTLTFDQYYDWRKDVSEYLRLHD